MSKPLVAVSDSVFPNLDLARAALSEVEAELRLADEPTPEAILAVAREADGMLVTYAQITGDMIRQLSRCRIIARFGIGVDNVDIEAATEAGIVVTKVPDYCIDEVSDHALALLMALARKIPFSNQLVHGGEWKLPAVAPLYRLRGRTLGLVGFGQIPRMLAPKAQALGIRVVAYDPYVPEEAMAAVQVEQVDLDALLQVSDYISVHAPLTPDTHHMFDREAFRRMKPGALLINTARGPLVDEQALVEALNNGELAGAALDVREQEPPPADSALRGRTDVILTPHTAFYSVEALEDLQTKATQEVVRVLRGERPRNPLNPEVLESA
ncbi:MAG TPA: C-terminal binding protein [Anaerolineae bacterium]|nr:C-terminal binding protein [Anaerolineae bacterium]